MSQLSVNMIAFHVNKVPVRLEVFQFTHGTLFWDTFLGHPVVLTIEVDVKLLRTILFCCVLKSCCLQTALTMN